MKNILGLFFASLLLLSFVVALSTEFPNSIGQVSDNVGREDALSAMSNAEIVIEQTKAQGIPFIHADDLLLDANRTFIQVEYANILRNPGNYSGLQRTEAGNALKLIDWKNISYKEVVIFTEEINLRQEQAFFLADKISVEEVNLANTAVAKNNTKILLTDAKLAFSEERYNDTNSLLNQFVVALEQDKASYASGNVISESVRLFFIKHPLESTLGIAIIVLVVILVFRKARIYLLRKKIERMNIEKGVLNMLMKKAQDERFNKGIISEMIYKIRMGNYSTKLERIKQELPVLEEKYRAVSKKKLRIK